MHKGEGCRFGCQMKAMNYPVAGAGAVPIWLRTAKYYAFGHFQVRALVEINHLKQQVTMTMARFHRYLGNDFRWYQGCIVGDGAIAVFHVCLQPVDLIIC